MQGERLPVPNSLHKMLIYSSGNCSLLICPTRKTLICHYSTMFYSSSLSILRLICISLFCLSTSFSHSLSVFLPHPRSSSWRSCATFRMLISIVFFMFCNQKNVVYFAQQDFGCHRKIQISLNDELLREKNQYVKNIFVSEKGKR